MRPADLDLRAVKTGIARLQGLIDEFTIIFVASPLTSPDFFYAQAGHELTAGEQKQLKDMREQFKANAASTEVIKTGAAPFVSVKVPQNADGSPVIFMVRVEHK